MMRGTVAHRPWAATLAALGVGGRTGQLVLRGGGKVYKLAFANGILVGATSPIAADSVSRIALAQKLVTPPQVQAITRQLGKQRADDVERFVEALGLPPAQVQQLKRRVILQRAARTFDVEQGDYTVDETFSIPVLLGVEVDVRAAIYEGLRRHQAQDRLAADLRQLGARFALRGEALADLPRFELGDQEQVVLHELRRGTVTLPELEATHRDADPRMLMAALVALAACDAIVHTEVITGRTMTPRDQVALARTPTPAPLPPPPPPGMPDIVEIAPFVAPPNIAVGTRGTLDLAIPIEAADGSPTPEEAPLAQGTRDLPGQRTPTLSAVPMLIREDVEVVTRPRTGPKNNRPPTLPRAKTHRAVTDPFLEAQLTTERPSPLSFAQVKRLISSRAALLGKNVDYFEFLGIPFGAPVRDVRAAYLELARYLRPERLKEMGFVDEHHDGRSVFAQVVIAYTVLTDPARRADYLASLLPRTH